MPTPTREMDQIRALAKAWEHWIAIVAGKSGLLPTLDMPPHRTNRRDVTGADIRAEILWPRPHASSPFLPSVFCIKIAFG
jgi:hypothetical protein